MPATVVVLNNGAPVAMSAWIGEVAAVLEAWMMGRAGGAAMADVLEMFTDMPLVSVLYFQQEQYSRPAETILDDLLRQVHGE